VTVDGRRVGGARTKVFETLNTVSDAPLPAGRVGG
jgi:hypothetical protein